MKQCLSKRTGVVPIPQLSINDIRNHLNGDRYRPQTYREICSDLRARGSDRSRIKRFLLELERRGEIVKRRNHRYSPVLSDKTGPGRFPSRRPVRKRKGSALNMDRAPTVPDIVVGQVRPGHDGLHQVVPFGRRVPYTVFVQPPLPRSFPLQEDPVIAVQIDRERSSHDRLRGRLLANLGVLKNPTVDSKIVIYRNALPREFSKEGLAEADRIGEDISPIEIARRKDLRALPFVTIDGEDARDHDDAVALESDGVLWIAIADVGHYVASDSALDRDALERGNSYYFPDTVLPMLPERLSNRICSLRPNEDRLVLAARVTITPDGTLSGAELFEGIIRSRARLTYEGVDRALEFGQDETVPPELLPMLRKMLGVTTALFEKRISEGGIDFDLSETRVVLNQHGEVTEMARRVRTPSQRIVEELMLAANRGVAWVLTSAGYPVVYRVHDRPEEGKLMDFVNLLRNYGYKVKFTPRKADPRELDEILHRFNGDPRSRVFSYLALRSMSQAVYATKNIGHYGLGFTHYAHFTSPIRRYADLIVHRVVRRYLHKGSRGNETLFPPAYGSLENVALQISERERVAQTAEREIRKLKAIRFFLEKRGKEYSGFIVGMVPRGFFVELDEHSVDGFVHVDRMGRERYFFSEAEMVFRSSRGSRVFRLGAPVTVKVFEASIREFRLDFSLVERS
ncbi:MAG TPA: VacB/RNase II family 3'-5' exoribonuclease [Bdellovibrionota bacterium]|nr:VacB/RNase II family 3'-5' exoribonuclease [Bdellovibrionota bacterium]